MFKPECDNSCIDPAYGHRADWCECEGRSRPAPSPSPSYAPAQEHARPSLMTIRIDGRVVEGNIDDLRKLLGGGR
jgi:hypothetical protein